jgi:hypothetical protein
MQMPWMSYEEPGMGGLLRLERRVGFLQKPWEESLFEDEEGDGVPGCLERKITFPVLTR